VPREADPAPREVHAFAPGRVNLIGEHTDYNAGLALPFAIAEGVTVRARARDRPGIDAGHDSGSEPFVRGVAAELNAAGFAVPDAELEIRGEVPQGAGLSSSAALTVALALALLGLADVQPGPADAELGTQPGAELDRRALARLCSRVENEWVGARTGLLDQLASLFGARDTALFIDFSNLAIEPVPLTLDGGWRLARIDSGERRALAASGYNERRAECARACELLGVASLRELDAQDPECPESGVERALADLPHPLARRVRHVLGENARVLETVAALRAGDLSRVGALLDASHASLREQYECSTPAVEATVARMKRAGAAGARMVGGGFGGSVLALFAPDAHPPPDAHRVRPARGAGLLS
jgi:galactokinase